MLHTESETSSESQDILHFSEKPFKNATGVELPGISLESQHAVLELVEKNRQRFHIFFNDKNYHNHFVHHLLGAYSFGASPEQLNRLFDKYASYQKPRPPSTITITRENWTEHLGNRDLWTDYLKFFDQVIKEDGMEKVFNTFAFHPRMFPKLFTGAFHPLIHLGYGVEFQIPAVLAEGLSEVAVHKNWFEKVIDDDFLSCKGGAKRKKIMDIFDDVGQDDRFDFITHDIKEKLLKLLAEKAGTIKEIAKQWIIPETPEGVKEATHELYEAIIIVYGSTPVRPDKPKIECDFFLMHGLTSMLLLYAILPYCSLEKRIMLLRSHFAAFISHYIAAGRPKFHVDDVMHYTPQKLTEDPNPWLDIIRYSLLEESDTHVLKVMRSLLKAQQEWAPQTKENIYVKVAQLTYDGFESYGWIKDIGFDEEWH